MSSQIKVQICANNASLFTFQYEHKSSPYLPHTFPVILIGRSFMRRGFKNGNFYKERISSARLPPRDFVGFESQFLFEWAFCMIRSHGTELILQVRKFQNKGTRTSPPRLSFVLNVPL